MKTLLAVDGSEYTQRMLSYLVAHKDALGVGQEYTALYTVLPIPHRAAAFAGAETVRSYYDDDARQVLEPVRAFFEQHRIPVVCKHRVGHPAQEIVAEAGSGGFELVVMGTHGHGALGNLLMGSVVTKVMASCPVPVLLIR